ncbi:MAG: N-acetyltransferase [Alphaproteobacteria bacterium]|nr:N-acetyltransferase [Alphaproteobacteria bacterium]
MMRNMRVDDIERIMEIWLATSVKSHGFISEKYWQNKFLSVKTQILTQANTIVWEEKNKIVGFISLTDKSHIGELCVDNMLQCKGIGSALILTLQQIRPILSVRIYAKNLRAVGFYRRHGFKIIMSEIDSYTGEEVLLMYWSLGYLTINDASSHSSKPQ